MKKINLYKSLTLGTILLFFMRMCVFNIAEDVSGRVSKDVLKWITLSEELTDNGPFFDSLDRNQLRPLCEDFEKINKLVKFSGRIKVENGELSYNYNQGLPNGEWKELNNDGSIKRIANFKNGCYDGLKIEFFPNGDTSAVRYFKEGLLHGKQRLFYPGEKIEASYEYNMGNMHGKTIKYFLDGSIRIEYNSVYGDFNGSYDEWYRGGVKKYEMMFNEGGMVSEKIWNKDGELVNEMMNESI